MSEDYATDRYYCKIMDETLGAIVQDPGLGSVSSMDSEGDMEEELDDFIVDDDVSLSVYDDEGEGESMETVNQDTDLLNRMQFLFSGKKRRRSVFENPADPAPDEEEASDESLSEDIEAKFERATRDRRMKAAQIRKSVVIRDAKRRRQLGPMAPPLETMSVPALGLKTNLFFHQLCGISWMALREEIPFKSHRGGLMTDDMGLGKTIQALTLVALDKVIPNDSLLHTSASDEKRYLPPTLIVCPGSLLTTWNDEYKKHFTSDVMRVTTLHKDFNTHWKKLKPQTLVDSDIVLINYTGLRILYKELVDDCVNVLNESKGKNYPHRARFRDWLGEKGIKSTTILGNSVVTRSDVHKMLDRVGDMSILRDLLKEGHEDYREWSVKEFCFYWPWRRVIFDECTKFKNSKTSNFKAVHMLQCERMWSMSGTPLENTMNELYAHLRILRYTEVMDSIKTETDWHRFLSTDKYGVNVHISERDATDHAIALIKRRVLNVIQLRREIGNATFVNPLGDYETRVSQDRDVWQSYVVQRLSQKSLRRHRKRIEERMRYQSSSVNRSLMDVLEDSMSDDPSESVSAPMSALERVVYSKLTQSERRKMSKFQTALSDGFYLDTLPSQFSRAYARVDHWIKEIFGISLKQLNAASLEIRQAARDAGGYTEVAKPVLDTIVTTVIPQRKVECFMGITIDKPILVIGEFSEIERRVYDEIRTRPLRQSSRESSDDVGVPFKVISGCRSICADYRLYREARTYLHNTRHGELWDCTKEASLELRDDMFPVEETEELGSNVPELPLYQTVPEHPPTHYLLLLTCLRIIPRNEKVVAFSEYVSYFPLLKTFLKKHGYKAMIVTGKTSNKTKKLKEFRETSADHVQILLGSSRSLNQGLNLQVANNHIQLNPDFNGAWEEQGRRRVARPGQKRKVRSFIIGIKDSIEELVITRASEKSDMITRAIGTHDDVAPTGANLSRPDTSTVRKIEFTKADYERVLGKKTARLPPLPANYLETLPTITLDHFANVSSDELFTASGALNRATVVDVLTK